MRKAVLPMIFALLLNGCGGGGSSSDPPQPQYVPTENATYELKAVSPTLAEEARNAALYELTKYLDLYGQAAVAFDAEDGYAAARPLAVLAMAHLFRRAELGGVQAADDLARAETILELLADAHLAGEWGRTSWLTSLPVLNMGIAARLGWSDLSPRVRNKISRVIKSEADYVSGLNPFTNYSANKDADCSSAFYDAKCDTKSEENAAMSDFLSFASSYYGHLDPAASWSKRSRSFAYHSLTTAADMAYGGYRTLTIFPDGTMGNHNIYPNVHYMLASQVLGAESILSATDDNLVFEEYAHNQELVWKKTRENLNLDTFAYKGFVSDYPGDSPLWFPSAFAYATLALGEDEALISALFREKAKTGYVALPGSRRASSVGCFDPEFFHNSNVLKRYLVTALLFANHTQGGGVTGIAPVDLRRLDQFVDFELDYAVLQYQGMETSLAPGALPKATDRYGNLVVAEWGWWGSGFYPGTLWYLYEHTGDEALKDGARNRTALLEEFKENRGTLDLGFMLYNSFGNGLRLDPNDSYRDVLLTGANSVASRYNPILGCLKPWDMPGFRFPVVIDNLMDLEFLFWAARTSGDASLYAKARSHADKTMNNIRADFSSYQIVDYDPATGAVIEKTSIQGYADDTAWARGQAWSLYGFTMLYRETRDPKYLELAKNIAGFLLRHPNMPPDLVPYWDFNAPGIPDAKRDTSSAAIIASALVELSEYASAEESAPLMGAAETILRSLASADYLAKFGRNGHFLLLHGVGDMPGGREVDVSLAYSDYYYVEALTRMKRRLQALSLGTPQG